MSSAHTALGERHHLLHILQQQNTNSEEAELEPTTQAHVRIDAGFVCVNGIQQQPKGLWGRVLDLHTALVSGHAGWTHNKARRTTISVEAASFCSLKYL